MKKTEPGCIQHKRDAAERWYALVQNMTAEERQAFYEKLNQQFREKLHELQTCPTQSPAA